MDKSDQNRVTIVDIAREVGVSPKTVSRAIRGDDYISPETLKKVQEAIVRLGYRPNRAARSLVSNRSGVIGVVIPNINNPFFSEIVRGIEDTALDYNYNVLLFSTDTHLERERAAYHYMEENGVDGMIIDLPMMPVPELEAMLSRHKSTVLIDHPLVKAATGVVRINFYEAAYQAVEYMARWGRRHPAYISPPGDYHTFKERKQGIVEAAAQLGMAIPPNHFQECHATFEESRQAVQTLLIQNPMIDSLICFNDIIGIGALEACDRLGLKVPEQVAIIGFDDIDIAGLDRIALTTFRVPRRAIGIEATQMLLNHLDGVETSLEVIMKTDFVPRKTTPPLP